MQRVSAAGVQRQNPEAEMIFCCSGNVELVNRLLLDAGITSELIKIWRESEMP